MELFSKFLVAMCCGFSLTFLMGVLFVFAAQGSTDPTTGGAYAAIALLASPVVFGIGFSLVYLKK